MVKSEKMRRLLGWTTVVVTFSIVVLWSYWGINEAFHEGWYHASLWQNLSLTLVQYLSVPIIFIILSLIALKYKRVGVALFIILGLSAMFFFDSNAGRFLIFVPLLLFALGFYFGDFQHKRIVSISLVSIFLLTVICFGSPLLVKVANRFNDHNFGMRVVIGNGVQLTWAPQGDGFPLAGVNWQTARDNCAKLDENGNRVESAEQNIWHLPTRDELVRSLTRKNVNAGGFINDNGVAQYHIKPDKETPLWNPHSQVIYYWTGEAKDETKAYLVAYDGVVLERSKSSGANYQGYRCVKD